MRDMYEQFFTQYALRITHYEKKEVIMKYRVRLTFPQHLIKEPVIFNMAKKYDIMPNIRRARVTEIVGEMVLELDGTEENLKNEGANPSGSFKDRGMTLAISKAAEEKSKAVICASTGNTSASASAYAVRAGISAIVLIPEGKIAKGKLATAMVHA